MCSVSSLSTVSSPIQTGKPFMYVYATDRDDPSTLHAQLSYSILHHFPKYFEEMLFQIDNVTGAISPTKTGMWKDCFLQWASLNSGVCVVRKQQHRSDASFWINVVSGTHSTKALVLGNLFFVPANSREASRKGDWDLKVYGKERWTFGLQAYTMSYLGINFLPWNLEPQKQ